MTFQRIVIVLVLVLLGMYLFATAPTPLPQVGAVASERSVPVGRVFDTINAINVSARKIYTDKIVGEGKKAGLKFEETWHKDDVEAGPLPALYMRLIAEKLQKKTPQIGLFLGSDNPINPSNLFKGEQEKRFAQIKRDLAPQKFAMPDGYQVAMYADIASAKPCVSCHNDHDDSPKKDWKLDDVMGAATWTFERENVSPDEYRQIVLVVYAAASEGYDAYLAKARGFAKPPVVGMEWPGPGRYALPDASVFMDAVLSETGPAAMKDLLMIDGPVAISTVDRHEPARGASR